MNKSLTFFKTMVSLCLLIWAFNGMAQNKNTWVAGSNAINQKGTYGTPGVGSTSNIPSARYYSISWSVNDTLWLFGGYGIDGAGNGGSLNDLWKFNKVTGEWTWVAGSNTINQKGTYGTQGVGSTSNIPGARYGSVSWSVNDTLWLFGGAGYDSAGITGRLNDLWKFNKVTGEWTWVSGSNTRNQKGTYGTPGVGSTSNIPGARNFSISWSVNDTLWLFGGWGRDGAGNLGSLNDLWKFNKVIGEWTWVSGSNTINQKGTYGTQGVGSTSNIPGARLGSISWTVNDTLWLFGGSGTDGAGSSGILNDLWKSNKVTGEWTWVAGSNTIDQQSTYGTKGVGSTNNIPGARLNSISWSVNDTLWLFGGNGFNGTGTPGRLNDLWKFNKVTQEWTWVAGTNALYQNGSYGTQGVGSASNIPGARQGSISWTVNDTLWLFGGSGTDGSVNLNSGYLNDLWALRTSCDAAQISTDLVDAALCAGGDTLFGSLATGDDIVYKWQINQGSGWSDINDETNDTLPLNAVTTSQNGYQYRAAITSTCGVDTTNIVTLTVNGNPDITNLTSSRNPVVHGYTPYACASLTATVTGGTGTLNYTWSPSGTGNPLNVCPTAGTWYKATVTDGNGCMDTMSIQQSVIDATSPYPGRVIMCYNYPRRAPMNINIYPAQVPQYLNAGATLGKCGSSPSKRNTLSNYDDIYRIYPNPANNQITLEWFNLFNEEVTIELVDMTGRVVQHIFNGQVLEGEINLITADLTELPVGMYFMRYSSPTDVRINKVQLMR